MTVIDVTDETFETEVVQRSHEIPVVVDFWAEWCGPCRMLTPVLERAAASREGQVVLAKLDTDANQRTAAQFGIQGIPAVKAFKDGKIVDEFVGAQPPAVVEEFFDRLVPSEAEQLAGAEDEESLRRALELEPTRRDAKVKLARMLHARGDRDEARGLVTDIDGDFQAEGLAARMRLEDRGEPDLSDAFAAQDAGDHEKAIDHLIEALSQADGAKDDIRQAIVGLLDQLGVEHPLARDARRRLAAALY